MTIVIWFTLLCLITYGIGSQLNERQRDPFCAIRNTCNIRQIYQWTQLEFDYPTPEARDDAIDSGEFRVGEITPIDIDVHYRSNGQIRMFITVPRFLSTGVPASLGTINVTTYSGNPIITPYPSWSWHQNVTDCKTDRIVSVYRIKIDECGRLWVLDSGQSADKVICPPQILVFDLQTDELINRYEIPYSQYESDSIFVTIISDVRNTTGCNNAFAYLADCRTPGLVVYDMQRNTSWKLVHSSMYPDPLSGEFDIAGETFNLMDGILGMDLTPYIPGNDRILYYHPLSALRESRVDSSYLRDPELVSRRGNFFSYSGLRSSQVAAQAIDSNGISYFGLSSAISLNCWNTNTPYGMRNIRTLSQDYTTLQFISGIKIVRNLQGREVLWFLSNRLQRTMAGTLDANEINFRAQTIDVADLNAILICAPPL